MLHSLEERRLPPRLHLSRPCLSLEPLESAFDGLQIREHQLGVHNFSVAKRVDVPQDVRHIRIVETAEHMDDGIHLSDIPEEPVAEPLPFGRAPHEPCDVHKLNGSWNAPRAPHEFVDSVEARVRHLHDADVGLDGAEGVVLRRRPLRGEGVKEGRFPHVGKTNDPRR